jgi:tRNA-binding EMAP/Myf-like protein
MQPVNSKSLFAFICGQMDKLDKKEITVQEAQGQASLAKQANNILNYELDRAKVQMQLALHNSNLNLTKAELREVESKAFDKTI